MSSNVSTSYSPILYGLTPQEFHTLFKPSSCWSTPRGRFGPNGLQKRLQETFPRYNFPLSLCDKICSTAGSECSDGEFGISRVEFTIYLNVLQQPDTSDGSDVSSRTVFLDRFATPKS